MALAGHSAWNDSSRCNHPFLMYEFTPLQERASCGICGNCNTLVVAERKPSPSSKLSYRSLIWGQDDAIGALWFYIIRYDHAYHDSRMHGTNKNLSEYGEYLEALKGKKEVPIPCFYCQVHASKVAAAIAPSNNNNTTTAFAPVNR
jgi:hypothetical protein